MIIGWAAWLAPDFLDWAYATWYPPMHDRRPINWLSLDINDSAAEHFLWLFTSLGGNNEIPAGLVDYFGKALRLCKLMGRGSGGDVNEFTELLSF